MSEANKETPQPSHFLAVSAGVRAESFYEHHIEAVVRAAARGDLESMTINAEGELVEIDPEVDEQGTTIRVLAFGDMRSALGVGDFLAGLGEELEGGGYEMQMYDVTAEMQVALAEVGRRWW
jgi:hypothetical protein